MKVDSEAPITLQVTEEQFYSGEYDSALSPGRPRIAPPLPAESHVAPQVEDPLDRPDGELDGEVKRPRQRREG